MVIFLSSCSTQLMSSGRNGRGLQKVVARKVGKPWLSCNRSQEKMMVVFAIYCEKYQRK